MTIKAAFLLGIGIGMLFDQLLMRIPHWLDRWARRALDKP